MKTSINDILRDLYHWEPKLQEQEETIKKTIKTLITSQPPVKISPNFKQELKHRLVQRISILNNQKKSKLGKSLRRRYSYAVGTISILGLLGIMVIPYKNLWDSSQNNLTQVQEMDFSLEEDFEKLSINGGKAVKPGIQDTAQYLETIAQKTLQAGRNTFPSIPKEPEFITQETTETVTKRVTEKQNISPAPKSIQTIPDKEIVAEPIVETITEIIPTDNNLEEYVRYADQEEYILEDTTSDTVEEPMFETYVPEADDITIMGTEPEPELEPKTETMQIQENPPTEVESTVQAQQEIQTFPKQETKTYATYETVTSTNIVPNPKYEQQQKILLYVQTLQKQFNKPQYRIILLFYGIFKKSK